MTYRSAGKLGNNLLSAVETLANFSSSVTDSTVNVLPLKIMVLTEASSTLELGPLVKSRETVKEVGEEERGTVTSRTGCLRSRTKEGALGSREGRIEVKGTYRRAVHLTIHKS